MSPFFSRLPPKARGVALSQPLWFPNKNVSGRQAAQLSVQQRAARVMERQRGALSRSISHMQGVDTVHPPARYAPEPDQVQQVQRLSHPPLRQKSTRDIVASMMGNLPGSNIGGEVDDNTSASTDSLNDMAAAVGRASIVPRDHLKGSAVRVTGHRS